MDWRDEGVPPAVVDAAAKHGWGALLTSVRASGLSPAMRGFGVVGLLLGLPFLAAMVSTTLDVPYPASTILMLAALVGGSATLAVIALRGRALYLFEGGALVLRDRRRVVEVVPWAEMVPIEFDQRKVSTGGRRFFPALHLDGARGRVFACTHEEAVRLADVIASVEVRRAWTALQNGRSVVYGPLTLTPGALVVGTMAFPWADVTRFRTSEWWLVVRGAGAHGAAELARVVRSTVPHQRTVISLGERLGAAARELRPS